MFVSDCELHWRRTTAIVRKRRCDKRMSIGTRGCVDLRPRWIGWPELTFGVARMGPWDLEVEVVDSVQRIGR